MKFIKKENINFNFSKDNKAVIRVNSGERVIFETYDCMTGQIKSENDIISKIDFNKVNPVTGPVFVENAYVGDTLKVSIESIELMGDAVAVAGEGEGVLGDTLKGTAIKIIKIENNKALINDLSLPLNKMIGVIGVAPRSGEINCGTPGSHGGNMDCKIISEGSVLYLPVFTEGALLSMGDVHALMGDGEIGVSGAEIAANVKVKIELLKNIIIENPMVETKDAYYAIASKETLDDAQKIAVSDMHKLILAKGSTNENDLAIILSLTADLEICQVVDPLKTIRFKMKKSVLKQLGINKLI